MVSVIDGAAMKSKSLFSKSMLLTLSALVIMSISILFVTQNVIKKYFEKESYEVLNRELELSIEKIPANINIKDKFNVPLGKPPELMRPLKSARSILIIETQDGEYRVAGEEKIFLEFALDEIKGNDTWPLHGQATIRSETIFYSITHIEDTDRYVNLKRINYKNLYYLAYISESYSADLTVKVMYVFAWGLMILALLLSLILLYIFKNTSNRLKRLEEGTKRIGRGQFDNEIKISSSDEIGRLGDSMNKMGLQLRMNRDEEAENFQMISHELKTPIMVMQGYIDAMIHDQYPNGTKEATYNVLVKELDKLENLTKDILFLNKADYLAKNDIVMENLDLRLLFDDVAKSLNLDSDISISINGDHTIVGDKESWIRVIENVISNQLRYAKTRIKIKLAESIVIENDGDQIDDVILKKIKKPFVKGVGGRSGLGLAIIDHTLKLYDFELEIKNSENGVVYKISKI